MQWRWIVDDSVFRKYDQHFRLVGRWYSGQFKRPVFAGTTDRYGFAAQEWIVTLLH